MTDIDLRMFQYRKRYGLHAMFTEKEFLAKDALFQYRKRYGLHAIANAFGRTRTPIVSIPQAVWIACNIKSLSKTQQLFRFNTASGMDCMQLVWPFKPTVVYDVSIPQAVWIACNTVPHSPWDS